MENENKNTSANTGNRHRHKNRSRKHKSYFITPAEANTESSAKSTDNKPKAIDPAPSDKQEQKNSTNDSAKKQNNPAGTASKHHNKRRRNHNRSKENQASVTSAAQPEAESKNEAPKLDFSASTAAFAKKGDKLEKPAPQKLDSFANSPEFEKYADYEEFSYEELYGKDATDATEKTVTVDTEDHDDKVEIDDEQLVNVVGIRFKASGKTYYFDPKDITLKMGAHAIVETARGLEYGEVALGNTKVKESETVPPLRPVIRAATEADIKHHADNKQKEDDAFRLCNEKIIEHNLDMKLIDAQYTFDNSKLLFYFTSSGRVDFRELVKDLACVFRTRIELRQIGIRDEAKMVGGLGLCGRPLCCSLFLTDFGQVSIKMAKKQSLSLNSSKISGICGRLMCCLRYEHDTYEYEIKRTPPVDTLVRTVDGVGVVTETSPLVGTIKVRLNESPEIPPKSYKREDVSILKKKK